MFQYDKLRNSIKKQNQRRSDENTFFQVLREMHLLNVANRVCQGFLKFLFKQLRTVINNNSDAKKKKKRCFSHLCRSQAFGNVPPHQDVMKDSRYMLLDVAFSG